MIATKLVANISRGGAVVQEWNYTPALTCFNKMGILARSDHYSEGTRNIGY